MQNSLINFNTDQLAPFTVGFDSLFDRLFDLDTSSTGYPPYDIIKTKEHSYVIEMALAGFSKNDIKIETSDGVLTVKSIKKNTKINLDHISFLRPANKIKLNDYKKFIGKNLKKNVVKFQKVEMKLFSN